MFAVEPFEKSIAVPHPGSDLPDVYKPESLDNGGNRKETRSFFFGRFQIPHWFRPAHAAVHPLILPIHTAVDEGEILIE